MKSFQLNYFLQALLIISFLACSKKESNYSEKDVFRYNEHANISSLDPAFAKDQRNIWACHQLYNTLVELDENLNIVSSIAKDWKISDDGLAYDFYLRNDVYFHSNAIFGKDSTRILNANDVAYSIERLKDPQVASPGSWIVKNIDRIEVIDNFHIRFHLLRNFPAFLGILSMKYASIIPIETQAKSFSFRENPVGSGPFYLKRWIENEKLVFRKNKSYWEKDDQGEQLPYIESIAITFLPDKQSEFMQFMQGEIDLLNGLHPSYKDELLTLEGELKTPLKKKFNLSKAPFLNTEYIGFYLPQKNSAIQNKNFRKAIHHGFDRVSMMKYLRNSIGMPATGGVIPASMPGSIHQEMTFYQPEKAKAYLEKYKTESGDQNPSVSIATNASYVDLIEFVQQELQKIGIQVKVDVMTASTLLQQRSSGQLEAFRGSWVADYPDAENYLGLFYSENFSPNGPNYTHFSQVEYDELFNQASANNTIDERVLSYQKMDSIIADELPIIPLFYDEVVRFTSKKIQHLPVNSLNLLELRKLKKLE